MALRFQDIGTHLLEKPSPWDETGQRPLARIDQRPFGPLWAWLFFFSRGPPPQHARKKKDGAVPGISPELISLDPPNMCVCVCFFVLLVSQESQPKDGPNGFSHGCFEAQRCSPSRPFGSKCVHVLFIDTFWVVLLEEYVAIPGLPGGFIIYQGNPSISIFAKRTPMVLLLHLPSNRQKPGNFGFCLKV